MKAAVIILLSISIAFMGCQKIQEKAAEKIIEKQTGIKVDYDKGTAKYKEGNKEINWGEGGSVKLPDGFPNDVYIDKNASIYMAGKEEGGMLIQMQSNERIEKIISVYKDKMKKNNWEIKSESNAGDMVIISFKKYIRIVSLMVINSEEGANIVLRLLTNEVYKNKA